MNTPLVSVLMPVLNAGPWLDEAIASVCLQTWSRWELLVLDDGSTDDSIARARAFDDGRIRVIEGGRRRGLPARLNEGVERAHGAFIARMDGDDIAYPERLARQVDFLLRHPLVDVVATDMLVMHPDGTASGRERWRGAGHDAITRRPWSGFHLNHATWLGRAAWFRRHAYREDAWRSEDDELLLRAFRTSRFHRLPEVLYAYRVGRLDLAAVRTARRSFVRALAREAVAQRDPRLLRGIPGQWGRLVVEHAAAGTGLSARMLSHRNDGRVDAVTADAFEATREAVTTYLKQERPTA